MLSLQLKSGEYLTIGDNIAVQIFEQSGSSFKVSVKAPREVPILRGDVLERTEKRPTGLHDRRPKSPSDRARNAVHFQKMAEKKEKAEVRHRETAEAQAAVTKELQSILDQADQLLDAHSREKLEQLRNRLNEIASPV